MKNTRSIGTLIALFFCLAAFGMAQPPNVVGQAMVKGKTVSCYDMGDSIICTGGVPTAPIEDATLLDKIEAQLTVKHILILIAFVMFIIYLLCGFHVVDQWDRRPMKQWGRYTRTLGPGITWTEPFSTSIIATVSIRDQVDDLHDCLGIHNIPSVQTHDNVPVKFRTLLTYKVRSDKPEELFLNVEDDYSSLWNRALATISEFVGNTELDSILHDRQALYDRIIPVLQSAVRNWGILIIAVELKDISIADESIQEAIAMKARAQKEAEAELTRAKAQGQIAEELSKAAAIYTDQSWKLKGFETLTELCRSADNNTIVIPSDLVQGLARVMGK